MNANLSRVMVFSLLVLLLSACQSHHGRPTPAFVPSADIPGDTGISDEEYEVISAAIVHSFHGNPPPVLVIEQRSDIRNGQHLEFEYITGWNDTDGKSDPAYQPTEASTVDNFRKAITQSSLFGSRFDLPVSYRLLTPEESRAIFMDAEHGWDTFYASYPDAPGILMVSRVGFNENRDQALLLLGSQEHYLVAGIGGWVFLVKQGDTWVVLAEHYFWVS